jgi:acyl carrier protein
VREFLPSRFRPALGGRALDRDAALFFLRRVDSFGVLELIAFLEDAFGVTIDPAQHDRLEFDSIGKIESLLGRLREGS